MKKFTLAVLTLSLLVAGASAGWAYPRFHDQGPLNQEQKTQMQQTWSQYMDQTIDDRTQLAIKTEQVATMLAKAEPDREKIAALQKEIINLRASLEQKAINLPGAFNGYPGGQWGDTGAPAGHYGRHGGWGRGGCH